MSLEAINPFKQIYSDENQKNVSYPMMIFSGVVADSEKVGELMTNETREELPFALQQQIRREAD
jgi:hypothetical protein